ncbi:MAG: aminomethyl-transferring glycine dehydrogenase subunit GcvPA [Thermoprotei archaeon]|nr:MAG: aminomethyl-transferring glycine dehydrogenase subunit GcvPA [Thermoprotei archaeon]
MKPSSSWIPNDDDEIISELLKEIGLEELFHLFKDIPKSLLLKRRLNVGLGKSLSEAEAYDYTVKTLKKNVVPRISFLGGGVWNHYVPAVVKEILSRGEFYTSYTPYQPEASQGLSQALFEYQSMIAALTGMDVVNASMYDWSTALAEAVLMAVRVTRRKKVLIPQTMNPIHFKVLKTITEPKDVKPEKVSFDRTTGQINLTDLRKKLDSETAAVYIENPSFLGFIEAQVDEIGSLTHEKDALFIVGVEPLSLGILRPPGDYGADIVVGEGQPLGLGMNFGGPLLGIFAVKWDLKLIRQMPGRIFGVTRTVSGQDRGFIMVLQTREQHIRRERATSNICTNEALCALAAAVYLSLLGPQGLRELAENILYKTNYLMRKINEVDGVEAPLFNAAHFKEFTVRFETKSVQDVNRKLLEKGIHGGLPLGNFMPEYQDAALYSVTEVLRKEDLDFFLRVLREIMEG